jgi:crotonobetainyl-CoA:carnitine CoA-transferase CaiB-like acyl-CoA transferase
LATVTPARSSAGKGGGEGVGGSGGDASGSLSGLVVADFSRVLAGPLATMFLGDLGATVVKVERPGAGDDTRHWGPPFHQGESTYFLSVNRNKYSVALDLTDPEGLRRARLLAERSAVLVENFRPGRLGELGLGYEDLSAVNPGLVYCSISGFGSGGGAHLAGYDFVVQAMGGLMSITGPEGGPPYKAGVAVVDVLTGLHATIGILAALRRRDRTGEGQRVEVNLLSSLLASLVNQASGYVNGGSSPRALGNRHPSIAPYETLLARGGYLALAVGNDRQFRALCDALELPGLADDERFATNALRVANVEALVEVLEARLGAQEVEAWVDRLRAADIACAPVNDLAGAFADAEALGLAPVVAMAADGHEVRTVASPLRLSGSPAAYRRPPPALGADTDRVLAWLEGETGAALP